MPSEEWKIRNFKQNGMQENNFRWYWSGRGGSNSIQLAVPWRNCQRRRVAAPHVASRADFPANVLPASAGSGEVRSRWILRIGKLSPMPWRTLSVRWGRFVGDLQGIDFAGKTGTAQTISGAAKAKLANGKPFKNNAWFVGVSPRRNPEIVVVVLWESGEEGPLAAVVASKVIKAYVDKQRKQPTKVAGRESESGSRSGMDRA